MRILFLGEIVDKPGVYCVKQELQKLREDKNIDFVIANVDGATGGFGIGKNHSIYLHKIGIDAMTSGECIFYKKDMVPHIAKAPYMVRPANYSPQAPGRGYRFFELGEKKIVVINMLGQSGFNRANVSNPFTYLPELAKKLREETPFIIVDFHASTTAEKNSMFHAVDGLVSAVIGTHTKAITSDARVLKEGTAVITDAGRTGSIQSVGGFDPKNEIEKYVTGIPKRSESWWQGLELQGVIIDIDDSGKATSIETLRHSCKEPENDRESADNEN